MGAAGLERRERGGGLLVKSIKWIGGGVVSELEILRAAFLMALRGMNETFEHIKPPYTLREVKLLNERNKPLAAEWLHRMGGLAAAW